MHEQYLKIVIDGLSFLGHKIKGRAVVRLYDLNVISEDLMVEILNCIMDLNLEDLNRGGINFPAIDLGDKDRRIAYQVTSQKSAAKIQKTLDTFERHKLGTDYDQVFVLILGEKQRQYSTIKSTSIRFLPATHIVDLEDLQRRVATLSTEKLGALAKIIEQAGLVNGSHGDTDEEAFRKIHSHFDRDALKHHWHQEGSIEDFCSALKNLTELLGKGSVDGQRITKPISDFKRPDLQHGLSKVRDKLGKLRAEYNKRVNAGEIHPDQGFACFNDPSGSMALNNAKKAVLDALNDVSVQFSLQPILMTSP